MSEQLTTHFGEPFPHWIREMVERPIEELTMFTDKGLVAQSIDTLVEHIGLPYDVSGHGRRSFEILFSSKAAPIGFLEAVDAQMSVSVSAGNLKKVFQHFPGRSALELYLGRPNSEDIALFQRYGITLIDVMMPKELQTILKQCTPEQVNRITSILYDGAVPAGFNGGIEEYVRAISQLLPERSIDLKLLTNMSTTSTPNYRHGQARGVEYATFRRIVEASSDPGRFGVNLYTYNPLDTDQITRFYALLQLNRSDRRPDDLPRRIVIGGFGGRVDAVPFVSIRHFIERIHEISSGTTVVLNLGTYLVEHSSVLVAPRHWTREQVNAAIPDLRNNPQGIFGFYLTDVGYIIYRPVAYPPDVPVVIR